MIQTLNVLHSSELVFRITLWIHSMPYVKNIQTITPLPAPVVNMSGVIYRGIEHITKDSHCFNITQAEIIQTPYRITRERGFSDYHTFRFTNAIFKSPSVTIHCTHIN